VSAPERSYRDDNHKPELVYALSRLDAMVGFRAPRRAAELLADLDTPLAADLHALLAADPTSAGVRTAFEWLLQPETRPGAADVAKFAEACARRLADGSPSPRTDRTVMRLAAAYPGDPGAVTSVLLNPVTLNRGEALFIPAGTVHAYLQGVGVEIMANSDNVLRAGLTSKHVDVVELLDNVDCIAAPPIRIAAERVFTSTRIFYAPVDDFELSVTRLTDDGPTRLPGRGPRILLCLEGEVEIGTHDRETVLLTRGQSLFVPASDGALIGTGDGTLVQADVP
jgi:mannose-6-phosphate isomerase